MAAWRALLMVAWKAQQRAVQLDFAMAAMLADLMVEWLAVQLVA